MCAPGCETPTDPAAEETDTAPICPPGSVVPCPLACPATEIEINNTPAVTDDLVALKCLHPAHRSRVHCRIRATGAPAAAATVVLTNPDGRLRFAGAADTTRTLTLPAD